MPDHIELTGENALTRREAEEIAEALAAGIRHSPDPEWPEDHHCLACAGALKLRAALQEDGEDRG